MMTAAIRPVTPVRCVITVARDYDAHVETRARHFKLGEMLGRELVAAWDRHWEHRARRWRSTVALTAPDPRG